jgi:hypothetical protein
MRSAAKKVAEVFLASKMEPVRAAEKKEGTFA